ncbi:hypothetical protein EZS27_035473, partial [termite gut metagenome]
ETLRSEGHKVLIFSSFVKHLELIARIFTQCGWSYALLTGASVNRQAEIDRFTSTDHIQAFLISLKAGGVGLNLTQADYVFIVDSIGRLVGQITVDDVMDEARELSERDYQLASGLSQDVETDDKVLRQTSARLPWLLIGMLGGIGNSMILGNFDSTFITHPEMALYIPLIGGTGGNVGTQSSAIVVQGLANSSLNAKNILRQVGKESVVAIINATIISILVYIYNFIRFGAAAPVTYSVSISLFAVVMFASIFGTFVPMTLERCKIDPAIATGPFIAISNDIIGMLLYMGITTLLA